MRGAARKKGQSQFGRRLLRRSSHSIDAGHDTNCRSLLDGKSRLKMLLVLREGVC
jgi:hypothetical protein